MTSGCLILPLTRPRAVACAPALADLDARLCAEIGSAYAPDSWDEARFLEDEPGRWQYSLVAVGWDGGLQGFWMAARHQPFHPSAVGSRRWGVDPAARRRKVATRMLRALRALVRARGGSKLVVEVPPGNETGSRFLASRGFRPTTPALRLAAPLAAGLPRPAALRELFEPQAWSLQIC